MNHDAIKRLKGTGGSYIRCSTDDQDTQRQHASIEKFLGDNNLNIPQQFRFEDKGWARDEAKKRPDFQRMLKAVETGLIQWIVCDRQDRFGTKDKFEFISFMHQLREHGCMFLTVDGKVFSDDSMMSFIEGGMNAETSEKELREKSWRVVQDRIERAKRGDWLGGFPPYGCDVSCFDEDMREKWRVVYLGKQERLRVWPDGRTERFDGPKNFPAADNNDVLQLRPSQQQARITTVQSIFETYATQAIPPIRIAKNLNKLGIKPLADAWKHGNILDVLQNPIYLGKQRIFGRFNGKYYDLQDGELILSEDKRQRRRKESEWILSKPLFEPVIDQQTWDKVQAKLSQIPEKKRAPKNPELFLTGLLICSHCGKKMKGWSMRMEYVCSSYGKKAQSHDVADEHGCTCERNSVKHRDIIQQLNQYLKESDKEIETFLQVFKTGNIELLKPFQDKHIENMRRLCAVIERMGEAVDEARGSLSVPNQSLGVFDPVLGWTCDLPDQAGQSPSLERLEAAYREIFQRSEGELRARLGGLESQHIELTNRIMNLPKSARRAIEREGEKLVAIERQMQQVEDQLANLSDELDSIRNQLKKDLKAFREASKALSGDSENLRVAEAIRQVIQEVRLYFEPTGKKWPKTRLISLEIVPLIGNSSMYSMFGTAKPS